MTYKVNILRSAQKRLAKIDDPTRKSIIDEIRSLAENPRPPQTVSGAIMLFSFLD